MFVRGLVIVALLAGVAGAVALGASEHPAQAQSQIEPPPTSRSTFAAATSRVISVRVFHTRIATVRNANAAKIGRSLASLRPTWVSGMLRYARHQYPTRAEVRAWNKVRRLVRRASPGAHFDVVLNAQHYKTPAAIRLTMRRLRAKLGNNGWFFDFLGPEFRKHPKMVRAAIASAHAHGEWVGGNIFGIAKKRPLPARADFLSVQDHVFHLNLPAVRRLAKKHSIIYHLNSDPAKKRSGGCRFIQRLSTKRRLSLIRRRAAQQLRHDFRFSYPALFPQCVRPRKGGRGATFLAAYNAFRDPPIAREIRRLLDRYDYVP